MRLSQLKINEKAEIIEIDSDCSPIVKQRLLDLGFIRNSEIEIENISPLGDPTAYLIHQTQISLRKEDAYHIIIKKL